MIFVTVGTQLPFDRLVGAVNDWALGHGDQQIIAQTGAGRRDYAAIECQANFAQDKFLAMFKAADIVVAHAGMGSILTAAELGKAIVIVPRRADLGEHRNDHQIATADKMAALSNVYVAQDANDVAQILDGLVMQAPASVCMPTTAAAARPELIAALRAFVFGKDSAAGPDIDAQVA